MTNSSASKSVTLDKPDTPKPKSIVVFSAQYAPHTGGAESYTQALARELAIQRHKVTVVCLNNCNAPDHEMDNGVEVLRLPCYQTFKDRYPIAKHNARYKELTKLLNAMQVDYVVVNTRFYPHSLVGVRFARTRGITPIVIEHGSAHLTLGNPLLDAALASVEHAMTRMIMRSNPHFYGVSAAAKRWLSHFGITAQGTLHNAIDAPALRALASKRDFRHEFNIGPNDLVLASVGRLVPEKGVLPLLRAMEHLSSEPVWCLFAGDGPLREAIEKRDIVRVRALGNLSKPDVAALLLQADALCLPSRSEGFATTLLEAAACGTPAIVTRVGGVDELICDERFGAILEDTTAPFIERAVHQALNDRNYLAEQGRAAQARAEERFTWQKTAEALLEACHAAEEIRPTR